MKHKITVHAELPHINTQSQTAHIKRCIRGALDEEGIGVPCEVNVLLTDNAGIRRINREYRNVDSDTDVLSFPMFELEPGHFPEDVSELLDPEEGTLPMGDLAISMEKVRTQAIEFGHSEARELGYLTVHSILHLLGYDHTDESTMKKQMREREEAIMAVLQIPRDSSND